MRSAMAYVVGLPSTLNRAHPHRFTHTHIAHNILNGSPLPYIKHKNGRKKKRKKRQICGRLKSLFFFFFSFLVQKMFAARMKATEKKREQKQRKKTIARKRTSVCTTDGEECFFYEAQDRASAVAVAATAMTVATAL